MRALLRRFGRTMLALSGAIDTVLGAPAYARYVAHLRATHPDREIPTREAFFRERQSRKWAPGSAGPCC